MDKMTIEGIRPEFFENKEQVALLINSLNAGTSASIISDKKSQKNIIMVAGSKVDKIKIALCHHVRCKESQIFTHGFKNQVQ